MELEVVVDDLLRSQTSHLQVIEGLVRLWANNVLDVKKDLGSESEPDGYLFGFAHINEPTSQLISDW